MADEKSDLNATAESAGGCVLTFQRWRRLSIFHLAACDVDHQLGELRWIAGAFESVLWRGYATKIAKGARIRTRGLFSMVANMRSLVAMRQRQVRAATIKGARY